MNKKQLSMLLIVIMAGRANGMASLRSWVKPAIFSTMTAVYASYQPKTLLCTPIKTGPTLPEIKPIKIVTSEPSSESKTGALTGYKATSKIEFREFDKKRDSDFLVELFQKNAHWLLCRIKTRQDLYQFIDELNYDLMQDLKIVILYADETPVGVGMYSYGQICYLCICEKQRGKGYATKLMQHMTDALKPRSRKIGLKVKTDNSSAISLYESLGFRLRASGPIISAYQLNTQPRPAGEIKAKTLLAKYMYLHA